GTQRVTDCLQCVWVRAAEEPIVQGGETNPPAGQLPLGPFVAIEADLDRVRGVATNLDERGSPLGVEQVDVVVIDVNRSTMERELAKPPLASLRGRPAGGPLLGDADQHDPTPLAESLTVALDHGILPLPFAELDPGDRVLIGPCTELIFECRGQ